MDIQIRDHITKHSIICIEAKRRGTHLTKPQNYNKQEFRTPITQAHYYMGTDRNIKYGICTNYQKFILFTKDDHISQYTFDFDSIKKHTTDQIDEKKLTKNSYTSFQRITY
jgi:uncharacterized metal-binding protein